MKSKEEILNFFDNEAALGFCTNEYALRLKWYFATYYNEYSQQSQPSGMRWVMDEIAFLEECVRITKEGDWSTIFVKPMQDRIAKLKDFLSESSPAGAAEGASEGISKIREVMNWISQCVDEDHDLEVSEIKMIWNDLSDAISLIESTPHSSEGMAEALRLLDTASNLVGNPGTNISSSTDLACDSWQEKYKKFIASLSPGVEDGSGWVKELNERQKSGMVHPYTCDRKHKDCEVNCQPRDYSKDGVLIATEYGWICPCGRYAQPLPTPTGVEDNQTKKQ